MYAQHTPPQQRICAHVTSRRGGCSAAYVLWAPQRARADAGLPQSWYAPLAPTSADADTKYAQLVGSAAHTLWLRGATSRGHDAAGSAATAGSAARCDDDKGGAALAFLVERITNARFPTHLLECIVKMIPVETPDADLDG